MYILYIVCWVEKNTIILLKFAVQKLHPELHRELHSEYHPELHRELHL